MGYRYPSWSGYFPWPAWGPCKNCGSFYYWMVVQHHLCFFSAQPWTAFSWAELTQCFWKYFDGSRVTIFCYCLLGLASLRARICARVFRLARYPSNLPRQTHFSYEQNSWLWAHLVLGVGNFLLLEIGRFPECVLIWAGFQYRRSCPIGLTLPTPAYLSFHPARKTSLRNLCRPIPVLSHYLSPKKWYHYFLVGCHGHPPFSSPGSSCHVFPSWSNNFTKSIK